MVVPFQNCVMLTLSIIQDYATWVFELTTSVVIGTDSVSDLDEDRS